MGAAFALAASRVRQGSAPRRAAALRRTAAVPQVPATVQLDAIATLMRRTLIRTSAPIFNSLRRMVLHACKTKKIFGSTRRGLAGVALATTYYIPLMRTLDAGCRRLPRERFRCVPSTLFDRWGVRVSRPA